MSQFQANFLESPCRSAYCRGLEDALKANPPMDPNNQEYLRGYYSLMMPLSQQWKAA
ncbi:MAG: hypothetical protein HC851_24640 [Acaryochloris sp. RU_4_1]|nr:hypothetical protein [Acaryochloris sp. RU_4_1]